jgi:E3 ubiquitin-protein ligase HERC2
MIDLLVSSLTADGGIETALEAAIDVEVRDLLESQAKVKLLTTAKSFNCPLEHENLMSDEAIREVQAKRVHSSHSPPSKPEIAETTAGKKSPDDQGIPLLNLVKQLLKNASGITVARLSALSTSVPVSQTTQQQSSGNFMKTSQNSAFPSLEKSSSPSVLLLLKFQRLLFSRLVTLQERVRSGDFSNGKIYGINVRF